MGRDDLVLATGYKKDTIEEGLLKLEALHLVLRSGRCHGWYLSNRIDQLALPGLLQEEAIEEDEVDEREPDLAGEEEHADVADSPERAGAAPGRCGLPANRPAYPEITAENARFLPYRTGSKSRKSTSAAVNQGNNPENRLNSSLKPETRSKKSTSQVEMGDTKSKKSTSPVNSVNTVVEIYPFDPERVNQVKGISTTITTGSRTGGPAQPDPTGSLSSQPVPSGAPGTSGPDLAQGLDPKLVHAFRTAGLVLNPRTRALALLPHVTPRYVRAHQAQLKANGKASHTGLLITILEAGIPAPETYPNGHLATCTCDECDRRYGYRLP